MLIVVVLAVGQAIYVLAAKLFPKSVSVALVGCMATYVVDDRSGAVGAGWGNQETVAGSTIGEVSLALWNSG